MKEELSFVLSKYNSDLDSLVRTIGCYENVESVFGIEFAAGIEEINGVPTIMFASDYLFTDQEDQFLDKYDGMVLEECFRDKDTKKLYNLNETGCRLDIIYDSDYHYTGGEQFSHPKIVTKGFGYGKKMKM